jgi:5-methylcytosine-specific restriction endonuclease McrA
MMFEFDMDFEREKKRLRGVRERKCQAEEQRRLVRRAENEAARRAGVSLKTKRRQLASLRGRFRLRFKAWTVSRIGPKCEVCSWSALALGYDEKTAVSVLQVHHIIPRACGGKNRRMNAVLLCPNCHALAHRTGRIIKLDDVAREWAGPTTRDAFFAALLQGHATAPSGAA